MSKATGLKRKEQRTKQFQKIYNDAKGICHICGKFVPWEEASRDHLIPKGYLKRNYTIRAKKLIDNSGLNIALAHKVCNNLRGNSHLESPPDFNELLDPIQRLHPTMPMYSAKKGRIFCRCVCGCKLQIKIALGFRRCNECIFNHSDSLGDILKDPGLKEI